MADINSSKTTKRLSKGQRTHNRRVKQAARKEAAALPPKKVSSAI